MTLGNEVSTPKELNPDKINVNPQIAVKPMNNMQIKIVLGFRLSKTLVKTEKTLVLFCFNIDRIKRDICE